MSWKVFAELVEMKAKTASVFPFVLGMAYSWYHYKQIYLGNMGFFFIAMLLFNMAVDILDNYMDYHNNYIYQWNLNKMTLVKFRNHLIAS